MDQRVSGAITRHCYYKRSVFRTEHTQVLHILQGQNFTGMSRVSLVQAWAPAISQSQPGPKP